MSDDNTKARLDLIWNDLGEDDRSAIMLMAERLKNKAPLSEPVVIKLRKPATFGSRTIEQMTIRPLKGRDMRRYEQASGQVGKSLLFASILSGEMPGMIDELEGEDLGAVMDTVNDFFAAIHRTGG